MLYALEFLGDELLHLTLLPHYSYAFQRVTFFGLVGLFLMAVIDGRLLDAGLPRWYRYPIYTVWLLSTSLPVIWPPEWLIGLALFALLLIVGCSIPGRPLSVKCTSIGRIAEYEEKAPAPTKKYPTRWSISPVSFLRRLLTIACFWLPLIRLEESSGQGNGVWIARFGYFILCIVWFYIVLGRLFDAGRLLRKRYPIYVTGFILLIMMFRRLESSGRSPQWFRFNFLNALSILLPWLKHTNGYIMLALFLLVQIPLAFLPIKPRTPQPAYENNKIDEGSKRQVSNVKISKSSLCGPFEYLRILLVIACFWIPLIYLDNVSGGSVGSWIARIGYLILGCFWLFFANGRIEDAGWSHSQYPAQFALVVSVASLMPFAVHWVNGYGALAIFVLIQTPTALLQSKRTMGGWRRPR